MEQVAGDVLTKLKIEKAGIEGERNKVEADDLGAVRDLAILLGADDKDVFRRFTLVISLLLDPAAVLLLLAATTDTVPGAPNHRVDWLPAIGKFTMRALALIFALLVLVLPYPAL